MDNSISSDANLDFNLHGSFHILSMINFLVMFCVGYVEGLFNTSGVLHVETSLCFFSVI